MVVSLVQSDLVWESPAENRRSIERLIRDADAADIYLLPEMFPTGFTMQPARAAESMEGETVRWMKKLSSERNAAICGSVVISEDGNFYNRLLFVHPDGTIDKYDKRHLFTLAGEEKHYTRGEEKVIAEFRGFKICLQVCYDLRFPAFARNAEDYDLLIYVANWPEARIKAWDALLRARAIENMCYVAAVNRVGTDGNGHRYNGHSQVIDFMGDYSIDPFEDEAVVATSLDQEAMLQARQKFGFLNDRDSITVS
jgi:omega-amidase